MDRIEKLIRSVDPLRADKGASDSPTEIIPTVIGTNPESESAHEAFSDDNPVVVPLRRRRKTAAMVLAGAAAAAVVGGAVVVGGSLGAESPLPAASNEPTPSLTPTPSTPADPTPSVSPTAEETAAGVPTGPPADEGCKPQDVDVIVEQGSDFMSTTPLTTNPEYYPVVGCTDNWMVMELTEEGYAANPRDGGNAWFYVAQRIEGQWLTNSDTYGTLLKWDTHVHPAGLTPQELMDQRFIDAGIPVELRPELVGEGPTTSELRETHQLIDLGVVFETRGDWDVVPASQGVDIVNAEGEKVANLQHSNASGLGGTCSQEPVPWEELGGVPVSVTVPGGAEVDGRFALRVYDGDPLLAAPSLIAADQPTSGESCMLYNVMSGPGTGLLALTTTFALSPYERGSALEFGSIAEAEAYVLSNEFAQLAAIADSITVTE